MTPLVVSKKFAKGIYTRASSFARYLSDMAWLAAQPSGSARTISVAKVSDREVYTSEQQFYPLSAYRKQIRGRLGVAYLDLELQDVLRAPKALLAASDIVLLKLSFQLSRESAVLIAWQIREAVGAEKTIVYFDGDDDLCVQWPEVLDVVDIYIKKQAFKDRQMYQTRFIGKSNITDYVARRFGVSFAEDPVAAHSDPLSEQQISKIAIGWNIALDQRMMQLRDQLTGQSLAEKPNDVVCRAALPADWMAYLRRDIEPILARLERRCRVIAPKQRVPQQVYLQEMLTSKICIGPVGYGEICWRDIEAVLCGCLLIKPDMAHVETYPDIYRPLQTYVPVAWDYSDLEEKCLYYLAHEAERKLIVEEARKTLLDFYTQGFMSRLTGLLGARPMIGAHLAGS